MGADWRPQGPPEPTETYTGDPYYDSLDPEQKQVVDAQARRMHWQIVAVAIAIIVLFFIVLVGHALDGSLNGTTTHWCNNDQMQGTC